MQPNLSINILSNELVMSILGYLTFKDLARSQRVCKKWNKVVNTFFEKYLFYKKVMGLAQGPSKLIGKAKRIEESALSKVENTLYITSLTCFDAKIAYSRYQVKGLSLLMPATVTKLYFEDLTTGKSHLYSSQYHVQQNYFLHLTKQRLFVGDNSEDITKYLGGSFKSYSLWSGDVSRKAYTSEDSSFKYVVDRQQGLVAMAPKTRIPTEKIKVFSTKDDSLVCEISIDKSFQLYLCEDMAFTKDKLMVVIRSHEEGAKYLYSFNPQNGELVCAKKIELSMPIAKLAADHEFFVAASLKGQILLLDPETLRDLKTFHIKGLPDCNDLQIHHGKLIVLTGQHNILVIDLKTGYLENVFSAACFACEDSYLFIGSYLSSKIRVIDLNENKTIKEIPAAAKVKYLSLDLFSDKVCLAAALENNQIQVWSPTIKSNSTSILASVRDFFIK